MARIAYWGFNEAEARGLGKRPAAWLLAMLVR